MPPKEYNNFPAADPKEKEINEIPDREFRRMVTEALREI